MRRSLGEQTSMGGEGERTALLKKERKEVLGAKQEYWNQVKKSMMELFGEQEVPEEILQELVAIRQEIKIQAVETVYLDIYSKSVRKRIHDLAVSILAYRKGTETQGSTSSEQEQVLQEELERYFESFRIAQNAGRFRETVREVQRAMTQENRTGKLNFYSEEEKTEEMVVRVQEKYARVGFSEKEIQELVRTCDVKKLNEIELQDLKILAKISDIFRKFMDGDKTKYVILSAGLLVPAFLEGYAPMTLAKAFQKDHIDVVQVGLYALLTGAASGMSTWLHKKFNIFLDQNFSKKGGIGQTISKNIGTFPPEKINEFGRSIVKARIACAKDSYESVYRMVSGDVLPTAVTLATSAAMLYREQPYLAAATIAGTGFMMMLDKYMERATGWWGKRRKAEQEGEVAGRQIEEQFNAHMEIVLSGMKDDLIERTETLLAKERVAKSDRQYAEMIRDQISSLYRSLNMIVAAGVTIAVGGNAEKFVAALVYSQNFQQGVANLLGSKRRMLANLRDIQQMELMFNGHAEEEEEQEKTRVEITQVPRGDILLKDVRFEADGKIILDVSNLRIPEGEMVHLSGMSGSGKTTFMKVVSGYYRPTSGEVRFGETSLEQIKKSGKESLYSAIGYLPQFPYVLEDTVRANTVFGLQEKISDEAVREVLREVGLGERFSNLNEQLKGGRGDTGTTSGGESARLGLARILLKIRNTDSRMVFLDEPTASVDEKTRNEIADILKREKRARPHVTFLVISHDKEFMKRMECSMTVKVEKGKVKI
ncbi:MAG: ABC transporter-related protein [Candidatus Uhrbacteria bacterium GW2011_GWF2_41_16]|uniref:ABC transporter-related protein n=2 Tax=Candidatus Uhriibacteriota TaxID=1752732 RepID=A0A0G0YCR5_9BACT|nr:MAG: ABC transporter-related protein [Candidatus Uhrbacteria bacterium GW2011_GWC2_41_11]KKR98092.1 MAG: ABC transporter-related protein [Candidatus Uhrbacteria bacterium GW2011_GWF2_41_16]HBO99642.1 hypothetical protein [Candidatus Uhrbacteria bacterium]